MDRTGQTLLGKYRLAGLLGQGGMGEVWHGTHVRTGRRVAIKLLDYKYLDNIGIVRRFGREARAASAIQHPGIVEVLDLDQTEDGVPFLVMEFLEGESLASRIKERGKLDQQETLAILKQLLQALEVAHQQGVVHRDIKPDNVFLVPDMHGSETVKVLDFGISQKLDEVRAHLTQTGSVLGTPHYMSPEQANGESNLDRRVDVYATGVLAYECVVGDVPFDANNYNRLLQIILNTAPQRPSERGADVDPAFEAVILLAMEKDRDHRPQSAIELLELFMQANEGVYPPGHEPPPTVPTPIPIESVPPEPMVPIPGAARIPGAQGAWGELDIGHRGGRVPSPSSVSTGGMAAVAVQAPLPSPMEDEALPLPSMPPPPEPLARSTPPQPGFSQESTTSGVFRPSAEVQAAIAAKRGYEDEVQLAVDENAIAPRSLRPSRSGSMPSLPAAPTPQDIPSRSSFTPPVPAERVSRVARVSGSNMPAAQAEAAAPASRFTGGVPKWALFGVLGLLGLVGLILTLRMVLRVGQRDPVAPMVVAPPPPEPTQTQPPTEPRDEGTVVVDIVGMPLGARVKLDGLPVGTLPMRLRRGETHSISISCDGYDTREISYTATRDDRIEAGLHPHTENLQIR